MKLMQRGAPRAIIVLTAPFLFSLALSPTVASAQQSDSKEARLAAAKEYLEVTNFIEEQKNVPPVLNRPTYPPNFDEERRKQADELAAIRRKEEEEIRKKLDVKLLERTALDALVETFTASELQGIVKFHRSPEGEAFRKKMRSFYQEYTPVITEEINKHRAQLPSMSIPPSGLREPMMRGGVGPTPPSSTPQSPAKATPAPQNR